MQGIGVCKDFKEIKNTGNGNTVGISFSWGHCFRNEFALKVLEPYDGN
jgi:hypothetical protein